MGDAQLQQFHPAPKTGVGKSNQISRQIRRIRVRAGTAERRTLFSSRYLVEYVHVIGVFYSYELA
jgi:hypothetical protein